MATTGADLALAALVAAQIELAAAQLASDTALASAANPNRTPVSSDVKTWVDAALESEGILAYYRALTP